jgi:hypothetical protein
MFKRIVTVLLKSTLTTTKMISPFDVEEASVEINWRTIFQLVLAWFIVVDFGVRSLWWWKLVHQHLRSKRCQWLRTSVRALRGAHPTGKYVTRKRHASDTAVEEATVQTCINHERRQGGCCKASSRSGAKWWHLDLSCCTRGGSTWSRSWTIGLEPRCPWRQRGSTSAPN